MLHGLNKSVCTSRISNTMITENEAINMEGGREGGREGVISTVESH